MEDQKFDRLARSVAKVSRRRALGAGLLMALGVGLGVGQSDARQAVCSPGGHGCTRDGQCCTNRCIRASVGKGAVRYRCACPAGQSFCGNRCVATNTTSNCGGCGLRCRSSETCIDGVCSPPTVTATPVATTTPAAPTCSNNGDCGSGAASCCADSACVIPYTVAAAGACSSDCQCVSGYACGGGICKKAGGQSCTSPSECATPNCCGGQCVYYAVCS
jgi:hypothetical protein